MEVIWLLVPWPVAGLMVWGALREVRWQRIVADLVVVLVALVLWSHALVAGSL